MRTAYDECTSVVFLLYIADVSNCIEVLKLMITEFEFIVFLPHFCCGGLDRHLQKCVCCSSCEHANDVSAAALTGKHSQTRPHMKSENRQCWKTIDDATLVPAF